MYANRDPRQSLNFYVQKLMGSAKTTKLASTLPKEPSVPENGEMMMVEEEEAAVIVEKSSSPRS